jgi:hypothetical protein
MAKHEGNTFSFPTSPLEALNIIINSTFRPFDNNDYVCFAGADETLEPAMCEEWGAEFIIIRTNDGTYEFIPTATEDVMPDVLQYRFIQV